MGAIQQLSACVQHKTASSSKLCFPFGDLRLVYQHSAISLKYSGIASRSQPWPDILWRWLSVANLSSEYNLSTFRLTAPFVIRAKVKEVWTNFAIYSCALLRIHVNGGRRSVRIAPLSLAPHHSGSATMQCMVPYTKSSCSQPWSFMQEPMEKPLKQLFSL